MVVGDDVAVRAHNDARTGAALTARQIDRLNGDDRGGNLGVNLLAGQAVIGGVGGRSRAGDVDRRQVGVDRGSRDRGRIVVRAAAHRAADGDTADQQDAGCGDRTGDQNGLAAKLAVLAALCTGKLAGMLGSTLVFLMHPLLIGCVSRVRRLVHGLLCVRIERLLCTGVGVVRLLGIERSGLGIHAVGSNVRRLLKDALVGILRILSRMECVVFGGGFILCGLGRCIVGFPGIVIGIVFILKIHDLTPFPLICLYCTHGL